MARGIVKWFDEKKGYGFIVTAEGEVFVHHSGIAGEAFKALFKGDHVEFDIVESEHGPRAENVVRVSAPPRQ